MPTVERGDGHHCSLGGGWRRVWDQKVKRVKEHFLNFSCSTRVLVVTLCNVIFKHTTLFKNDRSLISILYFDERGAPQHATCDDLHIISIQIL